METSTLFATILSVIKSIISTIGKYSLQGTTQSRYLTGGFRPSDFPCDVQAVACGGYGGNH